MLGIRSFSPPAQKLALLGLRSVSKAIRDFRPDVVMERFYNFAGAGMLLAHRRGMPSLLEVNAPMIDPPGSLKPGLIAAPGQCAAGLCSQASWSAASSPPWNRPYRPRCRATRSRATLGRERDPFRPSVAELTGAQN